MEMTAQNFRQQRGVKPIKRKSNAAGNLTAQLDAIRSRTNEKSYGSRDRYYEAAKRFCDFLADEFNLQSLRMYRASISAPM